MPAHVGEKRGQLVDRDDVVATWVLDRPEPEVGPLALDPLISLVVHHHDFTRRTARGSVRVNGVLDEAELVGDPGSPDVMDQGAVDPPLRERRCLERRLRVRQQTPIEGLQRPVPQGVIVVLADADDQQVQPLLALGALARHPEIGTVARLEDELGQLDRDPVVPAVEQDRRLELRLEVGPGPDRSAAIVAGIR